MIKINKSVLLLVAAFCLSFLLPQASFAHPKDGSCPNWGTDCYKIFDDEKYVVNATCTPPCNCNCRGPIIAHHKDILRPHVTFEFKQHRDWMIEEFWVMHILTAMKMMASQLSTIALQQVQIIGSLFDAKHQLETQRLFQQLMAEAHRDYMPSEGMCEIGTGIRSLATSSRKSDLSHVAFANRVMGRQLRNGDVISAPDLNSDLYSRIEMMKKNHCNVNDNAFGLNRLCKDGGGSKDRINKDVDYTRTIESKLTLDVDFTGTEETMATESGDEDTDKEATPDEEDVFALTANLFAHKVLPLVSKQILATNNGVGRVEAHRYMDLRSIAAKRSVAQNAFTAIVSERSKGDKESAQYLNKLLVELGVPEGEVEDLLGKEPSYFAQMEVLTKDIYQNPVFYTELYDKEANVLRKGVAIKAINLMQDRDLYRSQLRSEAVLSVLLETMLQDEHDRVHKNLAKLKPKEDN